MRRCFTVDESLFVVLEKLMNLTEKLVSVSRAVNKGR